MSEEIDREDEGGEEEAVERSAPRVTAKSTKTGGRKANGVGANAAPVATSGSTSKWTSREAELMWPEIIDWLDKNGHSPYEVEIQVVRLTPAGPEGAVTLGRIDGNAVMGDQQVAPGDRLMQVIIDQFHMPTMRGPARYEVRFLWKVGAQRIGIGILNVPSPAEIIALRNAAYTAAEQQTPPQHGMGAPRPQQQSQYAPQQPPWMQPPPWAGPPTQYGYGQPSWGYGPPPQYGQPPPGVHPEPGISPELAAMRMELAATRGALDEALRAAREGRQPQIPSGVAAPPASEDAIAEKVTARVLLALQKAGALGGGGLSGAPAQPAAAAPAPATPPGARGMMDELFTDFSRVVLSGFKSGLEKSVKAALGVGAPPAEEGEAEITEPTPAEEPFKPPFDVAPVADTRWPDGTPVQYAADRKTGDISPMGLAFGNPYMIDKGTKIVEGLTGALTDALKTLARPPVGSGRPPPQQVPPPEVVREIPAAAVDASASAPEGDGNNNSGFPSI